MKRFTLLTLISFLLQQVSPQPACPFRIFLSNDVCCDYTWGLTEDKVREYTAGLIGAHLDEMKHTDNESWENRSRYTCTITNELLFFLEKYPQRKEELFQRMKEGRIMISPFLCNSMWGFPGVEGFLRTMYPAKRLALQAKIPMEWAVHSEIPSLPQGIVPLLKGSGIHWICKPYLDYDATFSGLKVPPVFILLGPDSSEIRVLLDNWASKHFCYMQGGGILKLPPYEKDTTTIEGSWLPHYRSLNNYPLNAALAEGTHCDLSPGSWEQASLVAERIRKINLKPDSEYRIINSTFAMFAGYVDSIQHAKSFMKHIKGGFGHSWEAWPADMARYAAGYREQERKLQAAEALLAIGGSMYSADTVLYETYRQAEWNLCMLTDHAWNGSNPENKKHNAFLRKKMLVRLDSLNQRLIRYGWNKLGCTRDSSWITLFNPNGFVSHAIIPYSQLGYNAINLPEDYIICDIEPFGFRKINLSDMMKTKRHETILIPGNGVIESDLYKFNPGDESRLMDKRTNKIIPDLFHLVYSCDSSVFKQKKISSKILSGEGWIEVLENGSIGKLGYFINSRLYTNIDRMDIDIQVHRPVHSHKEVLLAEFGVHLASSKLWAETCGAVIRPFLAPHGDLLPGSDTVRTAVQGFVSAEMANGVCLTIVPVDAFLMLIGKSNLTFELFGNNQNFRESILDQNGETDFHFRFSLKVTARFKQAEAMLFSRSVSNPFLMAQGEISTIRHRVIPLPASTECIITALKPADPAFGEGIIIRLWETSGHSHNWNMDAKDFQKAWRCDLLEQNLQIIQMDRGKFLLPVKADGFACIRLAN